MKPVEIEQNGLMLVSQGVSSEVELALTLEFTVQRPVPERDSINRVHYSVQAEPMFSIGSDRSIVMPSGIKEKFFALLDRYRVPYVFTDRTPKLTPDYANLRRVMPGLRWRLRQDEALAWVVAENNVTILAPTGWGKSFTIAAMCALYPGINIVVAIPGIELAKEMHDRLSDVFPGNVGLYCTGVGKDGRIIVTTYQSMHKSAYAKPRLMIVDEMHNLGSPSMVDTALTFHSPYKRVGMTATHGMRTDGCDIWCEAVTGPVRMQVTYQDAQAAGVVVPIMVLRLNIAQGPPSSNWTDPVAKKRNMYWKNDYRNSVIALSIAQVLTQYQMPADEQVLVLVSTVDHALCMKKFLPDYELVHKTQDKDGAKSAKDVLQAKEDFANGKLRKVITTVWRTGIDFPKLRVIVEASGESGGIKVQQGGGRGSRVAEGKTFSIVIDANDAWDQWSAKRAADRAEFYKMQGWQVCG